jgi:RND family efflux transporter MFP subunit
MPLETPKTDLNALRINRPAPGSNSTASVTVGDRGHRRLYLYLGIFASLILIAGILFSTGIFSPVEEVETGSVQLTSSSQANAVLTASGYVVASRKAAVGSKGTGRLVWLGVEEGSHVKAGQIIGRLESTDVGATLQQAEASVAASKANLENSKAALENADSVYNREQLLFQKKLASRADLTTAQSQWKQAQAQVASSEANEQFAEKGVLAAQVQVEFTNIRAPFNGTVLTKDADVGDVMTPFGAAAGSKADIVTLADMSSLDAEVDVSESNIEQVHVGQPCQITLDAVPEKQYKGKVHMIVPTADRSKATILTKVDFSDIDNRVLPEMSLKVMFLNDSAEVDTTGPKLTVPTNAVVTRGGKKVVYVIHGDAVTETPIALGQTMGNGMEVRQGVSAGDKVVLNPTEKIKPGTKIKTKE